MTIKTVAMQLLPCNCCMFFIRTLVPEKQSSCYIANVPLPPCFHIQSLFETVQLLSPCLAQWETAYVHVCMCVCVHVHVCMCACVDMCMCACVDMCIYVCVHVCM